MEAKEGGEEEVAREVVEGEERVMEGEDREEEGEEGE